MDTPRRVLFNGISGIRLGPCVEKLAEYVEAPPFNRKVDVIKAEEHLCDVVRELGLLSAGSTAFPTEATILSLRLPKPLLRECWQMAFKQSLDELSVDDAKGDLFLHAHVCFYHQKTREFFGLLDPELLKKRFNPEVIITLVDDIEHLHQRLRERGQMFNDLIYDYRGFTGIAQACQNLSTLMHWRAAEFSAAEQLALQLDCPHCLLAVKHPLKSAANLIYRPDLPRVYVSHPISEPRCQLAAGGKESFQAFVEGLTRVCESLRERAVLFEPTTIDEFRFRRFKVSSEKKKLDIFLPSLTPRWPLADQAENLLWTPLDGQDLNPIDQFGHFSQKQLDSFEQLKSAGETSADHGDWGELEAASSLTGALVGEIEDQVAARDLKIVEQSRVLFVIRPLYCGNASGGVREEIRFHCQLVNAGKVAGAKIFIFTTKEDERRYKVSEATSWLFSKIGGADDLLLKQLRSKIDAINFDRSPIELVDDLLRVALKLDKRPPPPPIKTLNGTKEGAAIEEKGLHATELEQTLKLPYQVIIESYGGQIECEVQYGESWPSNGL